VFGLGFGPRVGDLFLRDAIAVGTEELRPIICAGAEHYQQRQNKKYGAAVEGGPTERLFFAIQLN